MFERFKNNNTEEIEPEPEYEYPVGTVPICKLKSGTYFYTFAIVHDKPVPSCLYRFVGIWKPSNRVAALGWVTDDDDGENLTEFDPDRKVMPVVVDDVPTTHNTHIEDLVVDEEGMEVYRVAGLLVDDNHDVLGLRLETPSWNPYSDYIFKKVLLTDKPKYRKIVTLREAIRKRDGGGFMKNREVLLKTDPCDLLCLIDSRLRHDYACIIDLLEGADLKDENAGHDCPCCLSVDIPTDKCHKCISDWLNSESKNNHFI